MKKENVISIGTARLLGIKDLQIYTGLGENRAAELGEKAGARMKYGSRVLYDRLRVDEYITSMQENA